MTITQIEALPDDLCRLAVKARQEGFDFVDRLIRDFNSGTNTFSETGESMFEVRRKGELVGVGGLNKDPYVGDFAVGRVRHVYVDPEHRKEGIGKILMTAIERTARLSFSELRLFTDTSRAAEFYIQLGYQPVIGQEKVSHLKKFET